MPGEMPSLSHLRATLDELRVAAVGERGPDEIAGLQLEHLLARVRALTEDLEVAGGGADMRLAERLLLADLALVAARLRAEVNADRTALAGVLEALDALSRAASRRIPPSGLRRTAG